MPIIEKSVLARPDETSNNTVKYIYPITAADCVYYNEDEQITAKQKIDELVDKIDTLYEEMENMTYEPLSIRTFTVTPSYVEKGDVLKSIVFEFEFNRVPRSIQLKIGYDTHDVSNMVTSYTATGLNITNLSKCVLTVYDQKNSYTTKSVDIALHRRYFYGAAETFTKMTALSSISKPSKNMDISVNANTGQYIYYCCPISNIDDMTVFNVGGFEGGFSLVGLTKLETVYNGSTFTVSNDGNILPLSAGNIIESDNTSVDKYTTIQTYAIYKSDNAGLGRTTIRIS